MQVTQSANLFAVFIGPNLLGGFGEVFAVKGPGNPPDWGLLDWLFEHFLFGDTLNPGLTLSTLRRIYAKTICLFWDRKTFETDPDENLGEETFGLQCMIITSQNVTIHIVSLEERYSKDCETMYAARPRVL